MLSKVIMYSTAIKSFINDYCAPGTIRSINRKDSNTIVIIVEAEKCPYELVLTETNNKDVVKINDALYIYKDGWTYLCRV